jgi:anthranilate synthase component I
MLEMELTQTQTSARTPLDAYAELRQEGCPSFLLESAVRGRLGRRSFAGRGERIVSFEQAQVSLEPVVGYLAYDYVTQLEPTVSLPASGLGLPESRFIVPDVMHRFEHEHEPAAIDVVPSTTRRPARRSTEYERLVRRAQEHIRAGDVFQVVLSQRIARPTSASALDLYRALRRINPSPYMFLLELGDLALIGSSPETLVKCEDGLATLNPIAGTAPPGKGDAERLLSSEKDRAEHVMLVDLGRNDLSRVCRPGTVRVTRFLQVERFSHVTHLVSEVEGHLEEGEGPYDLLRACFPAGTVSGAPKVRAMQLISEFEGHRRGPYAGAVGYGLPDGTLDTCIAIRTLALADGVAQLQAGAGIVADSDPAAEHRECLAKLAALEAAIDLAEAGT